MNDDVHVVYDSTEDAGEFLDKMADTIAKSLSFNGHGMLTHDEQTAFVWGFRYGIHQMNALLSQAAGGDEKTFIMIADVMTKAVAEWRLKVTARIALALPLGGDPDESEH